VTGAATNHDAARAAYELFRNPQGGHGDVVAVLHDDVVFECPFYDGFEPRVGKDVVGTMMRSMDEGASSYFSRQRFSFHELFPTNDPERFIIEAQGDHVIRATGKPYRNHYFHCLTIRDGKIVRWVEYSNPNEHARASEPG
jgi:ketosteroid isomerase-like protein